LTPTDHATSLANLRLERDAIVLYDNLARIERDPHRATAFRTIAGNERRHADIWAQKLREAGADVPEAGSPSARIRFILLVARVLGTRAVSDLVRALEGDEEDSYSAQSSPEVASIAADEREHAEIWRRLDQSEPGHARVGPALTPGPAPGAGHAPAAKDETWHRAGRTGTLRAAIFGVNDGLVSNLALVMAVTGASAQSSFVQNEFIVLTGVGGLLAGAFSMGAGEWISMQSQRELFERQIALEREELKIMPEEEEAELASIYERKGLPPADARRVADRLMADPEAALDTKVREELGLDPDELGSPWGAAIGSFVAFSAGAFVPVLPFLVSRGSVAVAASLVLAFTALFAVGAGVSLLTGRGAIFSGARQVAIGAGAAGVTYLVGSLIGIQLAG
jgi:VIT1/CCC1 family predicted Fe2+/Mn2+ transporter/rubrerythrin